MKALIHLSNGQYLAPANVVGATSFSWYTNGEQILSSSELYRIRSNNSLVIKYPGKAYSGIYQQVFRNEAGLLVIDQDVVMKTGRNYRFPLQGVSKPINQIKIFINVSRYFMTSPQHFLELICVF